MTDLLRVRAVQLTAVAALFLALAQMGKMITGESATPMQRPENSVVMSERESDGDKPGERRDTGVLSKTDGRSKGADLVAQTSPPAPPPKDATTERVIVTGSYIPPAQNESALPVTTYKADSLKPKPKKAEVKDEKAPASSADASEAEEAPIPLSH